MFHHLQTGYSNYFHKRWLILLDAKHTCNNLVIRFKCLMCYIQSYFFFSFFSVYKAFKFHIIFQSFMMILHTKQTTRKRKINKITSLIILDWQKCNASILSGINSCMNHYTPDDICKRNRNIFIFHQKRLQSK